MNIIDYIKKKFYQIKFRSEYNRKPWLFATLVGATPILIGLVLWDYFFLLSGMLALCFWLVLSILFLFEYGQGLDK